MSTQVEGFSAENPVPDEDWEDVIRWEVNNVWLDSAKHHDDLGWFADEARSDKCIALGHIQPEAGWGEAADDLHVRGWDGDWLCTETKYGVACTECESEDCPVLNRKAECPNLWALVSRTAPETSKESE